LHHGAGDDAMGKRGQAQIILKTYDIPCSCFKTYYIPFLTWGMMRRGKGDKRRSILKTYDVPFSSPFPAFPPAGGRQNDFLPPLF
jgi:hypothetical protein